MGRWCTSPSPGSAPRVCRHGICLVMQALCCAWLRFCSLPAHLKSPPLSQCPAVPICSTTAFLPQAAPTAAAIRRPGQEGAVWGLLHVDTSQLLQTGLRRGGGCKAGTSSQVPPSTALHCSTSMVTGGRQGTQPQFHINLQQSQEQVQVPQTHRSANSSQQRPEPGYAQRGLRDLYGPKQTLHYGADPTACPGQPAPAPSLRGGCGGRSGAKGTACMGTATLQPCSRRGDA